MFASVEYSGVLAYGAVRLMSMTFESVYPHAPPQPLTMFVLGQMAVRCPDAATSLDSNGHCWVGYVVP